IRSRIERLTQTLLRRHVKRRSHYCARRCRVCISKQLRESEVHNSHALELEIIFRRDYQNIFGLQIAMDYTLPVRGTDTRTNSSHQSHTTFDREMILTTQ